MRKLIVFAALFFCTQLSFAQTPGIKWSHLAGGTLSDAAYDVRRTPDGGMIVAGSVYSNNKDVTVYHGSLDLWIVKLNALGIIEWQKTLGGAGFEEYKSLMVLPDGSILVFANTTSSDGDVTLQHGGKDIWVIKLDVSGNVLWQRSLGGTLVEQFRYADKTTDNGCIITAYTESINGDVIGNHGGEEIWVIKLSVNGSIEWQKCLGGTDSEHSRFIMSMPDGNYVVVGSTSSNNGDVTGFHGGSDLWVIKISLTGTIIWQKAYGGSSFDNGFKAVVSNSGSLTVLANTLSPDGDVSGHLGDADTWIVDVSYEDGSINWQKCIGGSATESTFNILKDANGMFLIASGTNSSNFHAVTNNGGQDILLTRLTASGAIDWSQCFGGTKAEYLTDIVNDTSGRGYVFSAYTYSSNIDGYHQNSLRPNILEDAWIVKVDYAKNIVWQRCLGGSELDIIRSIRKFDENNFILAGETLSSDGDIQQRKGDRDYWIMQLGPTNTITGSVFVDNNLNGIKDVNEPLFSDAVVISEKPSHAHFSIPYRGIFNNTVDTGSFVTRVDLFYPYYNVTPLTRSSVFAGYFNRDSISFALQPISNKQDLSINVFALNPARPGFNASYKIQYKNVGTTTISSGQVLFAKDSRTNLVTVSQPVSSTNGDTLKWNYSNFAPGDTGSIVLELKIKPPPAANNGDTITSIAIITPILGDETPDNDSSSLKQRLTGSFDPNDKSENNSGSVLPDFITGGKYLQYVIRFQNTGTDTAFNVVVRDTLDDKLDWNSVEMIGASHAYSLSIEDQNKLSWEFNNILLADSNVNEPASHGYIAFRIKPKNTVVLNDIIHNTASIYFDFNLPVRTNDAATQILDYFSILPVSLLEFNGHLHNKKVVLNWRITDKNFRKIEVQRSINTSSFITLATRLPSGTQSNKYSYEDDISSITSNNIYYRLKMEDITGKISYSNIIAFRIQGNSTDLVVFPNPAPSNTFISMYATIAGEIEIKLVDVNGKVVKRWSKAVQKGQNILSLETEAFPAGTYTVQLIQEGKINTAKIVITR